MYAPMFIAANNYQSSAILIPEVEIMFTMPRVNVNHPFFSSVGARDASFVYRDFFPVLQV